NQDSINASLIFAGISQLASINHVASNDLVQALIEDVVSDGVFNGTANGTAILLNLDTGQGTIALSQIEAGALTGLAAAITSFADSSANACQVAVIGNLLTALANDPGLYVTPAAPSGVVATPGNGQITITWLPVAGANSYNVYVATESGVQSTATNLPGFASYLNVTSPYVLGNLSNGTPYYFVVTAVNGVTTFGTESPASTQVSATPSADLGASVTIDQSNPQSVSVNGTLTFTATVTGSSNPSVTWSVSPASGCGSIDASGTYTAPASPATCQVIATSVADPSAAASVTVNVTAPVTLVSIAVLPADATLAVGTTQQFVATGTYSNQTSANLTSQATWVSSNPTVATVGSASGTAGLATAVAAGTATISAEVAGVTGTTQLTVGSGTPTVVALSTGFLNSSCAILSNGNTMCWGWDSEGVLGDGNSVQAVSTPVLATNISASNPATAISMNSATCAVLSDGSIQCWGYNTYGSLGNGSTTSSLTPVITYPNTANNPAIQVSVGEYSACGLFHDGTISCWGSDQSSVEVGALGNGTSGYSLTPVLVSNITSANPATQISVGWGAACALLQDQTVDCWGSNYEGDLGDGTSTGPDTCSTDGPCSTVPVAVSNLSNVTAISVGGSNAACALKSDGTVWCWGANAYSQLGESPQSLSQADEPVQISGISTATAISVGNTSACALLSNGTVQCWGYILVNEVGGASQYTSQPTPVTVSNLSSATSITVGNGSACALLANGTVQCWGFNGDGNLGDGTTTDSTTPVQVIGLP
ncbi:MAG TPA: Ig-like domain-containing protein, partial [Steroidobacteraceae bacterium]|nr:Ig-like domain-containing protein [Steroidobacteraceae bacterium]